MTLSRDFFGPKSWREDKRPAQNVRQAMIEDFHIQCDRQLGRIIAELNGTERRLRLGPELVSEEMETGSLTFEKRS